VPLPIAVRTFGFVTLPGYLQHEVPDLQREHTAALTEFYGDEAPTERQIVRMLRPESPTFARLVESCFACPSGGFGAIAEQLYGQDIFCCYMEANKYVRNTNWHADHAINYNAPGCRFAFYLDDHLSADTGALRIIPRSHAPPLHSFLHKAHQQCGAPGHTDGGLATALGCARDEDIPAHVISSRPGDLTIFDQAAFHAAFGGGVGRRMVRRSSSVHCALWWMSSGSVCCAWLQCSCVFYLVPRTEEEDRGAWPLTEYAQSVLKPESRTVKPESCSSQAKFWLFSELPILGGLPCCCGRCLICCRSAKVC
jgi:hypothetical protein